jgi:FkbM family methyltransferase
MIDKLLNDMKACVGLTAVGTLSDGTQTVYSNRSFFEMKADGEALLKTIKESVGTKKVQIDGYWYPFMNDIARRNLGYGSDMKNVLSHVKDWSVAIDGGAQVGRVANSLAEKFDKVVAIELSPQNFECLSRNKKANVVPIHACLSNHHGEAFSPIPDKHELSPIFRAVSCAPGSVKAVPSLTIDELALDSCGFIKLDLQGFDYFALLGAEQTLRRFHPPVYFEHDLSCCERYGVDDDAPQNFLKGLGYTLLEIVSDNQAWI